MKRQHHQGFELITAETAHVSVTVIPELGARIMSLRDLRSGREWMWRPAGPLSLWRNQPCEGFPLGTFVGADECLPTIEPCVWQGRDLPDHGEAWTQPWALNEAALAEGSIQTSVTLPHSPLQLIRRLTLTEDTLRMDYALQNLGPDPEAWLWAWHPLMAIQPCDRLTVPDEVCSVRVELSQQPTAPRGERWAWPEPRPGARMDELSMGGDDAFLKAFAGPLRDGWAKLSNATSGASLDLRWDATTLPYLGLWLTRGGYRGWHHIALEPTNLPADSLSDGVRENSPSQLAPGETIRWWLEIELGTTAAHRPASPTEAD